MFWDLFLCFGICFCVFANLDFRFVFVFSFLCLTLLVHRIVKRQKANELE